MMSVQFITKICCKDKYSVCMYSELTWYNFVYWIHIDFYNKNFLLDYIKDIYSLWALSYYWYVYYCNSNYIICDTRHWKKDSPVIILVSQMQIQIWLSSTHYIYMCTHLYYKQISLLQSVALYITELLNMKTSSISRNIFN